MSLTSLLKEKLTDSEMILNETVKQEKSEELFNREGFYI